MGLDFGQLTTKPPKFTTAIAADIAEFYGSMPTTDQLIIYGFHGYVAVAEAAKFAIFSAEDGSLIFGGVALDVAGNFHVKLEAPIMLPKGQDIKVDVTLTTGRLAIGFDTAYQQVGSP